MQVDSSRQFIQTGKILLHIHVAHTRISLSKCYTSGLWELCISALPRTKKNGGERIKVEVRGEKETRRKKMCVIHKSA